ncbi:MAG: hypothetical protein HFH82_09560 [Lachnospiraceae bacterium]|nr:hypothetical protein [Lachnospiraceae bacterium]
MRILIKEFLKIIKHPVMWGLTAIFLGYNLLVFYEYIGNKNAIEYYHELHDTILAYGINLNHPNPDFNAVTPIAESYVESVERSRTLYDNLDMAAILEQKQRHWNYYPITAAYENFLRDNYDKLQKRLEEIRSTDEADYGFYPGNTAGIHSFLYSKTLKMLMLEMAVLMMLSVLYLTDYERIHKTQDIVLPTRTGKTIMCRKIFAGICAGFLFQTLLAAVSFGTFFHCVPFRGLWKVPVSTALAAEKRSYGYYPFITFRRMSMGSYFALTLVMLVLLSIVIGLLTAAVQLLLQNSYFTFLLKAMLYLFLFLIVPGNFYSFPDILICLNPSALWITSGCWFIENELILSFGGNEFWCIGLWAVLSTFLLMLGKRRYIRRELL